MPTDQMYVSRIGSSEYSSAGQRHRYTDVSGLRVVARCAPGASPKVVRVHADYGMRTVTFDATRAGRPPVVPQPGDVTVGEVTTDVYLGGDFVVPTPAPNQKGGYDWNVSGQYTYLQSVNRIPGTHSIPTGGYPFPVVPQDQIFNQMLIDNGVPISPGTSASPNPVDAAVRDLSAKTVKHNEYYPWPLTTLPPETVTNGLIGG